MLLILSSHSAAADQPLAPAEAEKLFAGRIAPLFKARCLSCHGEGKKLEGALDLRTRGGLIEGGESGAGLIPGKPELSWIYRAIRYDDEIKMPPDAKTQDRLTKQSQGGQSTPYKSEVPARKQRLTEQEVRWVHDWITAGAPWPAAVDMAKVTPALNRFEDPSNPDGSSLPNYSTAPPDYQYKDGDIFIPAARADEPKLTAWSAQKAAKYLDDGALVWTRQRQCVACHTNGAYMMMRPALTPYLGPPLAEVKKACTDDLASFWLPKPKDDPIHHLVTAWGLAEWDAHVTKQLSPETDQVMRNLCNALSEDGQWKIRKLRWIPYILNSYHNACMVAKAIGTAPGWLDKVRSDGDKATLDAVERLRKYLQTCAAQNDYDRVNLLWADLRWPGLIDSAQRQRFIEIIVRHQRPDGGWSLRSFGTPESWGNGNRAEKIEAEGYGDDPPSDGHMTGLALIVLREAGVAVEDERIRKGVAWLKANQRASGRWWTRSLNTDYWQFSTYHGTANALLALGMCGEIPRRAP